MAKRSWIFRKYLLYSKLDALLVTEPYGKPQVLIWFLIHFLRIHFQKNPSSGNFLLFSLSQIEFLANFDGTYVIFFRKVTQRWGFYQFNIIWLFIGQNWTVPFYPIDGVIRDGSIYANIELYYIELIKPSSLDDFSEENDIGLIKIG